MTGGVGRDNPEPGDGFWVEVDVSAAGEYCVVVRYGQDLVLPLPTPGAVTGYVTALMRAALYADYEAAVLAQTVTSGVSAEDAVGCLIRELRVRRPPVDDGATAPFRFEPFLGYRSRQGGVFLWAGPDRVGQWTVDDCRKHAVDTLIVAQAAVMDGLYRGVLVDMVGVDDGTARRIVDDLGSHRVG